MGIRQGVISVDPDEETTKAMVELVGEDNFAWATDYPHIDAHLHTVGLIKQNLQGLPERTQRKVLGENAARLYGLMG